MSEHQHHDIPDDHEDPLAGPTWMVGFIGVVLLVVIVLGVTALYYGAETDEQVTKLADVDPLELVTLRAAQTERLHGTYIEDRDDAGSPVRALVIPIDQAMEAVVGEMGGT